MKIMILTAATGGGHLRAASAIEEYVKANTDHDVLTVDTLKACSRLLDKTVCESYLFMARKAPGLFGALYKGTNKENRFSGLVPKLSSAFSHPLLYAINDYAPDAIITTHPFATEMVSSLKETGDVMVPLICLITDYGLHRAWLADEVDGYVVANNDMISEMTALGISSEKIHPFGIPVHSVFFDKKEKEALLKELDFDPAVQTVLFMAGSFGVTNIMKLYRDLAACGTKMQIIIITGKNQKLYDAFSEELSGGKAKPAIPTHLLLFTNEVEKYMQAADLLVTKPGGLTVSEALACNLPLAVFDAIPGQEEDNANFLSNHNMGIRIEKNGDFAKTISSLLADREQLAAMRKNCELFDKSQAVPNILALAEDLVGPGYPVNTEKKSFSAGVEA